MHDASLDEPASTRPVGRASPRTRLKRRWRLLFGLVALLAAGWASGVLFTRWMALPLVAKRASIAVHMAELRGATTTYGAEHGHYLHCEPTPVPVEELGRHPTEWVPGSAFDTLGWSPEPYSRGTFAVVPTADGTDFVVHGWLDGDNDGVPAHFTATRTLGPTLVTPEHVY